jgi:hypothetical protein
MDETTQDKTPEAAIVHVITHDGGFTKAFAQAIHFMFSHAAATGKETRRRDGS